MLDLLGSMSQKIAYQKRAALLSNSLVHYDQALFALLTPFIAPLLFKTQDPVTALMLTHALSAISILVHPVGALTFGWIGDCFGLRRALCYSLIGVAGATLALGSLPLFFQTGTLSPLMVLGIRTVQGFCAGGESSNGAIFVLEQTPLVRQNWMSSLYDASSTGGWFLASVLMTLLSRFGNLEMQWPWLCGLGGMVGFYGLVLRLSPVPYAPLNIPVPKRISLKKLLQQNYAVLLALIAVSGFSYTIYAFAFTLMNGYIPLVSTLSRHTLLEMHTSLMSLDILLLPCFGFLADHMGHRRQMFWAAIGIIIIIAPLFYLLQSPSFTTITIARLGVVVLGVAFSAPYYAWAQTLTSPGIRSRITGLGYTLGSRLIGGTTPVIALWLYQQTGWIGSPVFYLALTALAAVVAVYYMKPVVPEN